MYFIPDVLSFCIASVFIFITLSSSGLVTLTTQLWKEVSLLQTSIQVQRTQSPFSQKAQKAGRFGYTLRLNWLNKLLSWISNAFVNKLEFGKTKSLSGGVFFDLSKSTILHFRPTPNPPYHTSDLLAHGFTAAIWTCSLRADPEIFLT